MPDVVGKKLDAAKGDIEQAGYDDDVDVEGGGVFGVVVESNWTVCSQEPASGKAVTDKPRLTVDRSCDDGEEAAEPSESGTPTPTTETPAPETSAPAATITDISVDKLLDKLNSADMGGIQVGDQFRLKAELFESDAWGVGAAGEYGVMLKAKGGKDDLLVFVNEADAKKWANGTRVEMVVESTEVTIDGETSSGWLRAVSVKTLKVAPTKSNPAAGTGQLLKDLAAYADLNNTMLGRTVIDSIEPTATGFNVNMNPAMAGVTNNQARTLIKQWNQNIVDMLADAGRGASDGGVKYILGGEVVAQNKAILDPWSVEFKSYLE